MPLKKIQAADLLLMGQSNSVDGDVVGLHGVASDMWAMEINVDGAIIWKNVTVALQMKLALM
jgi:hypothetical protein